MSKAAQHIKFGTSRPRTEDRRFLTGQGRYLDDLNFDGQRFAVFVRSSHAHANILCVETANAKSCEGVDGIYSAIDLGVDALGGLPTLVNLKSRDGRRQYNPPYPPLALERVRYVGQPVAVVVADSLTHARDAAELVVVDYEELPAVTSISSATVVGAPLVWPQAPGNSCLDWETGDAAMTDAAFDRADHVTSVDVRCNRIASNSLEPRGAIANFDAGLEKYTLHVSSQGVHKLQDLLARKILKVPISSLRVITPDVGGGFGTKICVYPEYAVLLWVARQLNRPIKWISERSEAFLSDAHARDQQTQASLALDASGKMLGLRVSGLANLGAYLSTYGSYVPTVAGTGMYTGLYDLPAVHISMQCVFTNTVPLDAYRGAGKPEATNVLEQLVDAAAREMNLTPWELRRRNLVAAPALPYKTALGFVFDSGAFEQNLDRVLHQADVQDIALRRSEAMKRGKRLGLGMCAYFENTEGYQEESAHLHINAEGGFTLAVGTQSNGQGHETTFAQLVADRFGVEIESVRLVQGDTDAVVHGHGTGGSRSLIMAGSAVLEASDKLVEKACKIAAHLLETAQADIEFDAGQFIVLGTDRFVSLSEVARAAYIWAKLPRGMEPGLWAGAIGMPTAPSFPNGFHVCEVEVDADTGAREITRYTVVDDFGNLIHPAIVEGQVHGGTAQGIGQALLEECVYEADTGQLLSGSFMDYCMPRADDLPMFSVEFNGTPCLTNPLGVKGCGEAGAIAAPAAVINALVDALQHAGVTQIPTPASPQAVWGVLHSPQPGVGP